MDGLRTPEEVISMPLTMKSDFVATLFDLAHEVGVCFDHRPEEEEGCVHPESFEFSKDEGGGQRVRSVVEGQRDVCGVTVATQRPEGAPPDRIDGSKCWEAPVGQRSDTVGESEVSGLHEGPSVFTGATT